MKRIFYGGYPLEESSWGKITFLLGENGSGKSRELRRLALRFDAKGSTVIAISNTVFDRFPVKKSKHYARLSPASGREYVQRTLKQALFNGGDEKRDARMIARTLQYAGFDPAIGVSPVFRSVEQLAAVDAILRDDRIAHADKAILANTIGSFLRSGTLEPSTVMYRLEDDAIRRESHWFPALIRNESSLKRLKVLKQVTLLLRKGDSILPLAQASSGELTLIATFAFLSTRMREGAVVLVDEPENSLHPRWQSEYCSRLVDLFHLYSPSVFLASHSPLIVSGAESNSIDTRIVTLPVTGASDHIDGGAKSIDGILLEAFGVVSPASHYLSELITELLSNLSLGKQDLESVQREIRRLRKLSYDAKQKDFLAGVIELASIVASESANSVGNNEG